jgi:Ran GTPase-activating protein (RanGAP) involved in mRNA processing and transport
MVPQTLQVAMNSGMSDEQMAVAMCHTWTQQTILFAASTGMPDSQMARALGHAALRFDTPMHMVWKLMMGSKTWPEKRTLMMQLVSKDMRTLVQEVKPNASVICKKKISVNFVLRQFTRLAKEVTITHAKFSHLRMRWPEKLRLVTGLSHCRNIQILNLRDTNLGRGRGIQFLAKVLPLMRLKELNASKNFIDLHDASLLTEGLGKCTSLEILNLNDNGIFNIQVGNNPVGHQVQNLLSDATILSLHSCWSLTRLCLRKNGVGETQMAAIVNWMATYTPATGRRLLTRLNLAYGDFDAHGVDLIMLVAMLCPLEQLNLCDCDIGELGATRIAMALGATTTLTDLILASNGIRDPGAYRLADVLSLCVSLRCLDVCANEITIEGAQALADASWNCTKLTHLLLSDNDFRGEVHCPVTSAVKYVSCDGVVPSTLDRGMSD